MLSSLDARQTLMNLLPAGSGGLGLRTQLPHPGRLAYVQILVALSALLIGLGFVNVWFLAPLPVTLGLSLLGFRDLAQRLGIVPKDQQQAADLHFVSSQ